MKKGLKIGMLVAAMVGVGSTVVYAQSSSEIPPGYHERPPTGLQNVGNWGPRSHYLFEAQCTGRSGGGKGAAMLENENVAYGKVVSGPSNTSVQVQVGCDFGPPIGQNIIWRSINAWQTTRDYAPLPFSCGWDGGSAIWVRCRVATAF